MISSSGIPARPRSCPMPDTNAPATEQLALTLDDVLVEDVHDATDLLGFVAPTQRHHRIEGRGAAKGDSRWSPPGPMALRAPRWNAQSRPSMPARRPSPQRRCSVTPFGADAA